MNSRYHRQECLDRGGYAAPWSWMNFLGKFLGENRGGSMKVNGRGPRIYIYPGSRTTICFFSEKTIVLVRICNQQFQGTIILMVFDSQGYIYIHVHTL